MKAYHICHHTDEDGLASAAVIYEYLKIVNKKTEQKSKFFFHKVDYNMELSSVLPKNIHAEDEFYFVDYSFSKESNLKYLVELSDKVSNIVWIDHHITSLDAYYNKEFNIEYNSKIHCYFDEHNSICATQLAYAYAVNSLDTSRIKMGNLDFITMPKHIPLYIEYVNSWDVWAMNMPNTIEFHHGIEAFKHTPANIFSTIFKFNSNITSKLFSQNKEDVKIVSTNMKKFIDKIIDKGTIIKECKDLENNALCEDKGFEFKLTNEYGETFNCFAVNKRGNSTIFGDRINKYDFVIGFEFDGKQYIYSIYTSKLDYDCSALAYKLGTVDGLGGGGHTQAAGFQMKHLFIKSNCRIYIKNKLFGKGYRLVSK